MIEARRVAFEVPLADERGAVARGAERLGKRRQCSVETRGVVDYSAGSVSRRGGLLPPRLSLPRDC